MDVLTLLNQRTAARRSDANAATTTPSTYDPTASDTSRTPSRRGRQIPRDTVSISSEAHKASKTSATKTPSAYIAGDKDFDEVKRDMRRLMDARLRLAGVTLNKDTQMKTVKSLFGDITDRRALFAVYGDETDTFNDFEKKAAKWLELQQKKKSYEKLPKNNKIIGLTNYLDQASAEEKATFKWIKDRADAQAGLYGGLRGWQQFKAYGGVKTSDEAVDDLVSRLTLNMLMNWSSKTDYTKTSAYAKIKKDFDGLVDKGHTFTFTDGSKPEGLIGFLNRADKGQRAQFHALRKQANTQGLASSTKGWWQNSGKHGTGSNWWSSGGNRGVSNAIAMYNAALRTRRI